MKTLDQITNDTHFTLFKGEPGMRKSTQALTYPKPQYWFSFDRKMNALLIPMKKFGVNPKEISFDDYGDWTSARSKLESFLLSCPYKTIVFDSITSDADAVLRQIQKSKSGSKSDSDKGKRIGGIEVNSIEDYNAEAAALTELISLLKDIKGNHNIDVILIGHVIRTESRDLTGKTNISRVLVTAGKKPAAKIPAYCDEIYQFDMIKNPIVGEEGKYVVYTMGNEEDYARTTLPLNGKLEIGNDQLYEKFIKPAIELQKK